VANYGGKIKNYSASVWSQSASREWMIMLTGDFGVANINFVSEKNQLDANRKHSEEVFEVYYRMEAWAPIIDMLRNEDSTGFYFRGTDNAAMVYTGPEPVGEEES
jgi:hypothetical protein